MMIETSIMVVLVIMIMMTAKVCTHSAYADHHHPTHQKYEHVQTKTCFLDHLKTLSFPIHHIQGDFFNWRPPKKLKYGKPRLGEYTLKWNVQDTPNLA